MTSNAGSQRSTICLALDMNSIKPYIQQVNENEVLLRDNTEWLHFTHPHRVFSIETLDDVLPALHEIEQLVQENNWYAAGFLSYDAAPAFDPALHTRALEEASSLSSAPRNKFPYLWFGLYPKPRPIT